MDIQHKKFTPHGPPLKSLKVTDTDIHRSATYDFPLVIHSNNGPI